MYRLILLGGLSLQGSAGPLSGRVVQRNQLALLALLARTSDPPLTRAKAVGLLWPEHPEDRARARLSDAIYVIRKELGEDVVDTAGDAVRLNFERVWSDVPAFEDAVGAGRWEEAVELYTGPFLEGAHVSDEAAFERWVDQERARLAERHLEALEALAEESERQADWNRAVGWWRRRAAEERTNSRVATRLMRALAAAGNVPGALEHARVHELLLQEELGVALPVEVRSLAEELAAGTSGRRDGTPGPGLPSDRRAQAGEPGVLSERGGELTTPAGFEPASPTGADQRQARRRRRRRPAAIAGAAALGLIAAGAWISGALEGEAEDRLDEAAIADIEELMEQGFYHKAFAIARRSPAGARGHPDLARLLPQFTWLWPELHTDPPGARVLYRPYTDPEAEWEYLGTTPLDTFRLPLGGAVLRFERDGYRTVDAVPEDKLGEFPVIRLDPPERLPEDMVRIPGAPVTIHDETAELGDFFMGRYPVTNREYLRFVEVGGYRDPAYWEHPFVLDGDTLSWHEAMGRFTDRTGRPGPSTWMVSRYPDGQGDYPVGGVSWYEAAAYAKFAGRSLPSVHHWRRAYGSVFFAEFIIPVSNLQSDGPTPVGVRAGMGPFGTFDMAGNVREWTFNAVGEDRYILGGGWNDPDAMALTTDYVQPAFDRSPTNGLRLVTYLEDGPELERALAPVAPRPAPDFAAAMAPFTDGEFRIVRRMFTYDAAPLEARLEAADTTRHWVRQTISFSAAYGGDRVLLHLFIPRRGSPPFQTVVYWPGSGARFYDSIDEKIALHTDFIVQSGRAVAFPVLKGTLERRRDLARASRPPDGVRFRDLTIERVQDVMRTIDFLETRCDIDAERLAFYGWSWGGSAAPLVLSLESRFEAAVLHVAGLSDSRPLPEVDPLNHLPRVTLPVLMINGRLDAVNPLETHARPFFDLLGTPAEHKRFAIAEGGHFVPRYKLIRESLDWLDRYLGRVDGLIGSSAAIAGSPARPAGAVRHPRRARGG
jgi:DNA-binding SARP family transcriptional activator/dienelactone hydrolase